MIAFVFATTFVIIPAILLISIDSCCRKVDEWESDSDSESE